jgi:hypothetical protein
MPGFTATSLSPHEEDDLEQTLVYFVLNMLYRLIIAEEFITKRSSCMRIFVRMDISVCQHNGKLHYVVNELTRSHQTSLFMQWDDLGRMDLCLEELKNLLHFIVYKALIDG